MTTAAAKPPAESPNDYIARLVAAAPPITPDHPAAPLLIELFKEQPPTHTARRKTA